MVVAIIALIVACSGTAVAAGVYISSSNQLRDGVVTGTKIRDGSITAAKLSGSAVTAHSIRNGQISTSKLTPDALRALESSGTQAFEYFRKAGPEQIAAGNSMRVLTADGVPAGVYAIFAKAIVTDLNPSSNLLIPGKTADAHCDLGAGGDIDTGDVLVGTSFGSGPGDVYTQITHTFSGPGTITLDCEAGSLWRASDATIIAVRLGNASRQALPG